MTSTEQPAEEYYWDVAARTALGAYITEVEADFIESSLRASGQGRLGVDVGAGSGRLTRILCQHVDNVIATEITPGLLTLLRSARDNIAPVLIDRNAQSIPVRTGSADALLCIEVPPSRFDWFPDEAARVLRPGGKFIATLQNRNSWKGLVARFAKERYASSGAYGESLAEFKNRVCRAGFVLERAQGFNWLPFSRASDSGLVPLARTLESFLQLRRWTSASPWIILRFRRLDS